MIVQTAVLLLSSALGQADAYPRADLLVEPRGLAKLQAAKGIRVLDARPRKNYEAGHIPEAVWVDHEAWSKAMGHKLDPTEWAERVGELGIDNKTKVVIYDDSLAKDAARIWWTLRYWGVKDVRLINGGLPAYVAAGLPLEKGIVDPGVAKFKITSPDASRLADKSKVLDILKEKNVQIIDARSEKEHCGDDLLKNKKGGAIPGAIHLEWTDALDKKTQKFRTAPELMKILKDAGIDVTKPAVTHCQSGGRAAVMAFTLELMGAKDVSNYYRGWSEWGNSDDTPIVTPKKK